jgi:hypothetical protein
MEEGRLELEEHNTCWFSQDSQRRDGWAIMMAARGPLKVGAGGTPRGRGATKIPARSQAPRAPKQCVCGVM